MCIRFRNIIRSKLKFFCSPLWFLDTESCYEFIQISHLKSLFFFNSPENCKLKGMWCAEHAKFNYFVCLPSKALNGTRDLTFHIDFGKCGKHEIINQITQFWDRFWFIFLMYLKKQAITTLSHCRFTHHTFSCITLPLLSRPFGVDPRQARVKPVC